MTRPTLAHADPRSPERTQIVKALENGSSLTNEQGWMLLNALESEEGNVRELMKVLQETWVQLSALQKALRDQDPAILFARHQTIGQAAALSEKLAKQSVREAVQSEEELPEWGR